MRPRKKDRHLPRCVYLRHGAYWLVKGGKWTRLGSDLHSALAEYAAHSSPAHGTMGALIDTALKARERDLAENTRRAYKVMASKLKDIMLDFSPEQVMPRHIANIRHSFADSPAIANRAISVLRLVFGYALEQQLIDADPTVGIKRMKEAERDRLISQDEYGRIHAKALPRLRVIMDLCYLTGQRIGDVLSIRHSDISADGISFQQGKTDTRLIVRWTPELRQVVDAAKALDGNVRALTTLLRSRDGTPLKYRRVVEQWDAACKAAGVENAHLHDLRAMSGTAAEAQGVDPQKLLGHTSPQNTKRYLRAKKIPVVDGPSFGQVVDNWTDRFNKSSG